MIALAGAARGQPSATEPIATFLAKRVPEELATEGVVLSRANLRLEVEQLADKMIVSLVDLSTGRVAASTKIDQLPEDRDAAVASVTHVAAELAAQAMQRPIAPPTDSRADAARRDIDEMKFRRDELWFPPQHGTTEGPYDGQRWRVFRGDTGDQLQPVDFYKLVGRDDLAAAYDHRRNLMITGVVAGSAGFVVATVLGIKMASTTGPDCSISLPPDQFSACLDSQIAAHEQARSTYGPPILLLTGASLVGFGIAWWYGTHLQPIPESEARSMAEQYNQNLRRGLGLPVVARSRLRDVHVAPFVSGRDGGLVLGARF